MRNSFRAKHALRIMLLGLVLLVATTSILFCWGETEIEGRLVKQDMLRLGSRDKVFISILGGLGKPNLERGSLFLGNTPVAAGGLLLNNVLTGDGFDEVIPVLPDPNERHRPSSALNAELEKANLFSAMKASGTTQRGLINLFGKSYYLSLHPIKGPDGALIGVLCVALEQASILEQFAQAFGIIGTATGVVLILLGLVVFRIGTKWATFASVSEDEVRRVNAQLDTALDHMANGLAAWNADGTLIFANRRFEEIVERLHGSLKPGVLIYDLIQDAFARGVFEGDADLVRVKQWITAPGDRAPFTFHRSGRSGKTFLVTYLPSEGGGWLTTYDDITERHRAEAALHFLAQHDVLTGLANRVLFDETIERALETGQPLLILYLDLDHFKDVNDTLGHPVGDVLLREVAQRILQAVPAGATVARLGGDEFAIMEFLDTGIANHPQTAEALIASVARPYLIDGHELVVSVSVGAALSPQDGQTSESLLKCADMALYRAKASGRRVVCYYEDGMGEALAERQSLQADLRRALENGELAMYYQPLIDTQTMQIKGFEALMRWTHPVKGPISPMTFIPIAEESGLINVLGAWSLGQACADAAGWLEPVTVAVNISAIQFRAHILVDTVKEALAASGLAPHRLELEITESVLLRDTDIVAADLHALRALGVRIAMDDFGTGYSSLTYLCSFPFDKIKIDKSFISRLGQTSESAAIVRAVTGLAETLGIRALAEGVETAEQFEFLVNEGCHELQGYMFSKPIPNGSVADALQATLKPRAPRASPLTML
jgi:diguanylate cyclase (GGDEF)-like protein